MTGRLTKNTACVTGLSAFNTDFEGQLMGLILHKWSSINFGHYMSMVKVGGIWYQYGGVKITRIEFNICGNLNVWMIINLLFVHLEIAYLILANHYSIMTFNSELRVTLPSTFYNLLHSMSSVVDRVESSASIIKSKRLLGFVITLMYMI